jgi:hypothetical protein
VRDLGRWIDTSHLVDRHGLVGCPHLGRDVEASRCLTCPERLLVVRDSDGELQEIRCNPPPREVRSPWDLLLAP